MKVKLNELFLLLIILTFSLNLNAQDPLIDSLKLALKNAKHDTTRSNILNILAETAGDEEWPAFNEQLLKLAEKGVYSSGPNTPAKKFYLRHLAGAYNNVGVLASSHGDLPKALEYYQKSLKAQEEIKEKLGIAHSLNNIGLVYQDLGNIPMALEYYHKSLKINEEINEKKGIARTLTDIGVIYNSLGDIPKALEYFHKSLKIREEIKDRRGIATTLNNIGTVFNYQGDNTKALEYYYKSLKIDEEIKNKSGIATSLVNIGFIYEKQLDLPKALEYYLRSLKIYEEIQHKKGIAVSLNNIGVIYDHQGDKTKGLEYYYKSLKIKEEIKDKDGIAGSLNNIAGSLMEQGMISEALSFAARGMQVAKELGFPDNIKSSANTLKRIYKKQNKFKEAFAMYELETQMRDSINNAATKKASIKKQFQYQYEKKAAADSVKNGEEQKVKNALLAAQKAQLKQEKTKSYALYGGLALVLVFSGFMVNRFRVTNKQKQIIELKEIETQKQNIVITQQKHLVEEKHKEITDSINYAERIQRSFIATKELLDENLNDYFVFFKPKDVVSGDFYWAASTDSATNKKFVLCTADSTGHGVPGAIMSLLNVTSLEKAIEHYVNPADILNHTRQTIINRLKKDGSTEGGKDGMDCSLIVFDYANKQLQIAAANNPVWIIRSINSNGVENKKELIEIKPDKMPVGKNDRDQESFTFQTIDLQKGDTIYTLTDGLPDQFGGPKGKKFMSKKLKELLLENVHLSLSQQKEVLDITFKNWVGNLEQVDDVCVIGIRV
jgi:serine phosphatase RsbU (regulator of sigma subunit)/Tfp pilus assembly protein PilF